MPLIYTHHMTLFNEDYKATLKRVHCHYLFVILK